jgi:hypothetical protein
MIILAFGSGNHSNRLFQNIHFEAFCKENNIEYINPSFFNMRKYYVNPCKLNKGFKGFIFFNRLIMRIIRKLGLLPEVVFFDTKYQNNMNVLLSTFPPAANLLSNDVYAGGWYFRVPNLTEKYQDYFIRHPEIPSAT